MKNVVVKNKKYEEAAKLRDDENASKRFVLKNNGKKTQKQSN
jgi:hypothetical protein